MIEEKKDWNKTGVWICSKCHDDSSVCEGLKLEFKSRFKEMGLSPKIRVMTSSCLGQCPENKQAVLVKKPDQSVIVYEVDPITDREELFLRLTLTVQSEF